MKQQSRQPASSSIEMTTPPAVQGRILLIDDDEATRYTLSRILVDGGYEIVEAATGSDGLQLAQGDFDLVILDVQLPDISGLEVCRRIRKSSRTTFLPILQISAAFTKGEDHLAGVDSGADGYITLPVDPPVLLSMVKAWVRMRKSELLRDSLIVEKNRADRKAEEARAKLEVAVESAGLGSWHIDLKTQRLTTSSVTSRILGIPLTLDFATFLEESVHPDDFERIDAAIKTSIRTHAPYSQEHRIIRPDGTCRWVFARGLTSIDETGEAISFSGVTADITEQVEMRSQAKTDSDLLATEEQKLEAMIAESPFGVALLRGPKLIFEKINHVWTQLVSERDYLGLPFRDVYPELANSPYFDQLDLVYKTGQPYGASEIKVAVRRGPKAHAVLEERYFDIGYVQIRDAAGRPYGVFSHSMDVTDRVHARKIVHESALDLGNTLESMSDAFFSVDRTWIITRVNRRHEIATQKSREDQIGKNLLELFFADPAFEQSKFLVNYRKAMVERVFVTFEDYYAPINLWTEVRVYPKDDGGLAVFFSDITARKEVDLNLQREQHKLETIFEQSPAAMALWRGSDLVFEKINPVYQRIFGDRTILGKPLLEALPEMAGQPFPKLLQDVFETGKQFIGHELEARLAMFNGGPLTNRYFDVAYVRIEDPSGKPYGVYNHAIDVTERVLARRHLEETQELVRRSQEQIANAVKVSRVGFYDWDIPTNAVTYSEEMQKDWGIEGKTLFEEAISRIHPEDAERTKALITNAMRNHQRFATEYRVVRPDGRTVWIEAQGAVTYDDQGRPIRFFGTSVDITERKRAQHELESAKLAADAAREEAERANELKSAFLANMSHEIRTPLGAMLGFADLVRDPGLSVTERMNYIDILVRNGESLSVIINDILDLSKVEAGHLTLEYTDTYPDQIAADVVSLLRVKAKEKDLALEYTVEPSSPPSIVSDPTRVRQILLNLLGNAIKFTQFGSVHLRSFAGKSESGRPSVCFEISDTGIGIAAHQIEHVFEMFVQADGTMTRRFGGTGLGLALSRRLARALGGDVTITKSVEGAGTTFLVTIEDQPLHKEAATSRKSDDKQEKLILKPDALKGVKVLVVDDAPDNQQLIWRYLTKRGAIVESAENGWVGYRKALEGDFDIVLMDIQMPVMDGYAATQKLRDSGYRKPVIALTAHAMTEVRKKALNVGYTDHLPKPINAQDLIQTIAKLTKVDGHSL